MLNYKISLFVPSTIDVNTSVNNSSQVNYISTEFAKMFGGFSAQDIRGGWLSESVGLVTEGCTVVFSYTDEHGYNTNIKAVRALAAKLRDEMRQECVTLVISKNEICEFI